MVIYLVFWGCDVQEIFRTEEAAKKYIEKNGGYDRYHIEIWTVSEGY